MSFASVPITNVSGKSSPKKSRKEIFVDRLKGKTLCRVTPDAPEGIVFTLCNEVTTDIQTVCKISGLWYVWGTISYPPMTNVELEEYLSEQLDIIFENGDDTKMLRIVDNMGVIEWY